MDTGGCTPYLWLWRTGLPSKSLPKEA